MPQAMNLISILAAFLFGTGSIYILLDATVGKIKKLNSKFEWNGFLIKDFIFLVVSVITLLLLFDFKKPY